MACPSSLWFLKIGEGNHHKKVLTYYKKEMTQSITCKFKCLTHCIGLCSRKNRNRGRGRGEHCEILPTTAATLFARLASYTWIMYLFTAVMSLSTQIYLLVDRTTMATYAYMHGKKVYILMWHWFYLTHVTVGWGIIIAITYFITSHLLLLACFSLGTSSEV